MLTRVILAPSANIAETLLRRNTYKEEKLGSFLDAAIAFPTAIFTTLLGVVVLYWVLAVLGVVDFESGDIEPEAGDDVTGHDLGALASYIVAFGLHGVPLSIVVSLLVLVSWMLSCLGGMWLLPLLPGAAALTYPAGAVLALASVSLAVPIASRLVRPLRGLFVTHVAISNASLVGQVCKVLTQSVDEKSGRAEVAQRGASINIRVWANTPNPLVRGASARIVAYEDKTARYRIEAM